MLLGLIVLYAISPARVELINQNGSSLDQAHFMQKQLLYLAIGLTGFGITASLPFAFWRKTAAKWLLAGFGACLLLAILGVFLDGGIIIETGGATRWYNVGIGSFQPAELLKFGMLLFLAVFLARRLKQGNLNNLTDTLVPVGVLMAVATLLVIVFQKDMGTGITMFGMVLAMLMVSGLKARWFALIGAAVIGLGVLLIITSAHRMDRVLTFFNPSSADEASSYHITQAAIALGSGGLTGKGLGHSVQAFGYLPEAVNDSIFAILGETFGFAGLVVILTIFFLLLRRLLSVVEHSPDPTMRLVVAGVFGLIASHVVVNVGAMTGVFPLTGVTLPFLSFGGTSLLFAMLGLGLVLNISRYTTYQTVDERKETSRESAGVRGRIRWSRDTGSSRHQRA
jgi:cell division protein FtsW